MRCKELQKEKWQEYPERDRWMGTVVIETSKSSIPPTDMDDVMERLCHDSMELEQDPWWQARPLEGILQLEL